MGQIGIEYEDAFADRFHEIPWLDSAHGSYFQTSSVCGIILPLPRGSLSAISDYNALKVVVGNVHYRCGGSALFYPYVMGR
jgi:hypothetical protein